MCSKKGLFVHFKQEYAKYDKAYKFFAPNLSWLEMSTLYSFDTSNREKKKTTPGSLLAVVTDKLSCEEQAGGGASDTAGPLGQDWAEC